MQTGKKRYTDFIFQLLQMLADAGLGQTQFICRCNDTPRSVDLIKILEKIDSERTRQSLKESCSFATIRGEF